MKHGERVAQSERAILDPCSVDEFVLADRARMLGHGLVLLTMNVANAAIVTFVLRPFYPAWILALWLALFVVVVAGRISDMMRFRRAEPDGASARAFIYRYAVGSTLTGCLWGAAASCIWITPDPAYHAFVVFVAGGMAAGAVLTNAACLPAMFGFVAPAVLPAIVALFVRMQSTSVAMGALLSAFVAVLSVLGVKANGWLDAMARQGRMQEALASALHHRSALLHAISTAASELTKASPDAETIPRLLQSVGETLHVDRISALEAITARGGATALSPLHLWRSEEASPSVDAAGLAARAARGGDADFLLDTIAEGRPQVVVARAPADGPAARLLEGAGALSALLVPICVDSAMRGLIALENCRSARDWTEAEIDALQIAGDLIGGSIARQRYVDQLRDANEVVERSPTILFRLRADPPSRLAYVSRNVALFGHEPSALIGSRRRVWGLVHRDDRKKVRASLARSLSDGRAGMVEFRFRRSDGGYRWLDARYAPVQPGGAGRPTMVEGVTLDVTERREAAERISLLAQTDALTDIANRRAFIDALRRSFAVAARGGPRFSLLYIDIDHFKSVNDTLGHASGDALLAMVAGRLRANCRAGDLVARLGGDEFAILQTGIRDRADVIAMASKMRAILSAPYALPGGEAQATVSVGVAIYSPQASSPEALLAQADQALYSAKAKGRDQWFLCADETSRLS
jgi:diguanylate cyclase (GGDEF)-like protein/PAS domain S-box-containing protein